MKSTDIKIQTHVYMLKPRFARLVESGVKVQTIRPIRKRMPKVGELADLRQWTGRPYHSLQRKLRLEVITDVELVALDYSGVMIGDRQCWNLDQFAQADGFQDWPEMLDWFNSEHGMPFGGFITRWSSNE